jgi:putative SOS response-associated peptidase YedK
VGLPAFTTEATSGHQFPVRGSPVPGWALSGAGLVLLRVHRTKSPKTKWRFSKLGEPWFCFAGLWRPIPDGGSAFTLLTTDPSSDVAPIHDRQMVILDRSNWSAWLEKIGNEADLLRALPPGSLEVEQVR